jgi:hypothetical protein
MPALRVHDLDGPCRYDFLVDASEGRDSDLFRLVFQDKLVFQVVLIKAIGIGVAPKALSHAGDIIILANSSVWTLKPGASAFQQHGHQFPVIDYAETENGLLVFDHIGCIMLDFSTYVEKWSYHRAVLEDYGVEGDVVSLTFDDRSTLRLESSSGLAAT